MSDVPDTSSTATRFEWGNAPTCASGPTSNNWNCEDPSEAGPRNFFGLTTTLPAHWTLWESHDDSHIPADGGPLDATGNPQSWADQEMDALTTFINAYTAAGFSVTASQESFLGPGQRGGYLKVIPPFHPSIFPTYNYAWTKQRGGALIATKYDGNGDPIEIAHAVVGLIAQDASGNVLPVKGGGGGTPPGNATTYNPASAADILKSRFVDRSNALGVNLANGSMSYDSPASISVGSGGFPYELSAGFSFRQGAVPTIDFGPIFPGSPAGWTGSWDNSLSLSSSGMEGMGVSDVRAAAATIAAFAAEQDVYKASPSVARDVAAALTQAWLTHQFAGNTASATVGGATRQFVKLADGSWVAPGAGYATLTQTGTRAPFTYVCPAPHTYSGANYALSRGWDASGLSFTVTNAAGDAQNFGYWQQHYDTSADKPDFCGRASGFRMDTWTFPQGMTVTLGYGTGTTYDGTANSSSPNATYAYPDNPFPLTVSNGLGRTLTFGTDGTTYQPTVTDGNGRTLTGPSLGVASTTDPFGTVYKFHTSKSLVIRAICNHVLAGKAHGYSGFWGFQLCGQH